MHNVVTQPFRILTLLNNRFILDNDGIVRIKQIKGILYPICVVGPVLTGKSTLLNKIIGKEAFSIGKTTMPCSKGVYAYVEEAEEQSARQITKLYLDVQGFDNSFGQGNSQIDILLFSLLLCICKIVIYNSFGALDSQVFERIASPTQILPDILHYEPTIAFVQWDFSLKLNGNGRQLQQGTQYLQYCMKNYKDKSTITKIFEAFGHSNKQNQGMECFLISNPQQGKKYENGIKTIQDYIKKQINISLVCNEPKSISVLSFIYNLTKAVQMIQDIKNLKNLYNLAQKQKQLDAKNFFTSFKATFQKRTFEQLSKNMPMPEQLLLFKLKSISKQCQQQIGTLGKKQQAFVEEMIGQKKITELLTKTNFKLLEENKQKIKDFIKKKVQQIETEIWNKQSEVVNFERHQMTIIQQLTNYYPFITQPYIDLIKLECHRKFVNQLVEKISELGKLQQNNEMCSKQKLSIMESKVQNLERTIKTKQSQIDKKAGEIQELKEQILKLQKNQALTKQTGSEVEKYHGFIRDQISNEQAILKQIQNQLRQNLMYQRKSESQPHSRSNEEEGTMNKHILQSINKVLEAVQNNSESARQQQKKLVEKVALLQSMNKKLRERIEEIMSNSCAEIIERKYQQSLNEIKKKQGLIQQIANEKETVIQKLNAELRHNRDIVTCLNHELELIKSKATDKSKTSEFMQKLLNAKQKMLEQARVELLQNLTRYKEQINSVKNQARQRQIQISTTLSMFVVQNEQLSNKNAQLSKKIMSLEAKLRKESEQKILQKQTQIKKLSQNLAQFEKNLSNATGSYMQVTTSMEKLIRQKDQSNHQLALELQQLDSNLKLKIKQLQNIQEKYEQSLKKIHRLQIEKEEFQSKIGRQQILSNNRIRHLEQLNEKVKAQMRQKQSTFQMMLLQLRSQNMIANNAANTVNILKEQSRQKYLRRIDQIEEIAVKQLQEISNLNYRKDGSSQKKLACHTRSQNKSIDKVQESENNKYCTDKKPSRLSLTGQYSSANKSNLFLHPSLQLNTSVSSSFKTVAKRI